MSNRQIVDPRAMPAELQLVSPIRDVQLIALMASKRPEIPTAEAVAWAADLLIEAQLLYGGHKLAKAMENRQKLQNLMQP